MYKSLPEVKMSVAQERVIYNKIRNYFDDLLFSFIDEVMKDDTRLNNSRDDLLEAIRSGKVSYENGIFKAKRFTNKLAKELEELGATYTQVGYRLASLPPDVAQAVAQVNIRNQDKIKRIQKYLEDITETQDYAMNVNFDDEVKAIGENLDKQFKRSMSKIDVIPADLTDFQLKEIAKNYTTNLDYYIKKWTPKEIEKLRLDIQELALKGYRAEELEKVIEKHKNVSLRKAKFLARQETKLLVAEYRKNRFKQEGVTLYRWSTVLDGRERELHRDLNGKIFSWSEPPIIDAITGERGNPGEAYNCRCSAIPVIDEDWWKR